MIHLYAHGEHITPLLIRRAFAEVRRAFGDVPLGAVRMHPEQQIMCEELAFTLNGSPLCSHSVVVGSSANAETVLKTLPKKTLAGWPVDLRADCPNDVIEFWTDGELFLRIEELATPQMFGQMQ